MKRLTDKELMDAIEASLSQHPFQTTADLIVAYAQLRALDRLADNVHVLNETLSVILADLVKRPSGSGLSADDIYAMSRRRK